MMTFQKIASAVAKIEGKKSQARIGDIREILKILVDLEAEASGLNDAPLSSLICAIAKKKKGKKK